MIGARFKGSVHPLAPNRVKSSNFVDIFNFMGMIVHGPCSGPKKVAKIRVCTALVGSELVGFFFFFPKNQEMYMHPWHPLFLLPWW